ncbi:beta strand repeat-containing protein, partial [Sulfurimonas sp.]|uniref:beta strand repeat-containing protein n=1 Tax=Sulfurimonas sp. TaxID=2022749 RepID=UPI003568E518
AKNASAIEALDATETDSDVFTMTVTDGDGALVTKTYTVNVTGADDRPVAVDDVGEVDDDATLIVTKANGVIDNNDYDVDGDTLTVTAIRTGSETGSGTSGTVGLALVGTYGTLTLNADGSYTYVADQAAADALAAGVTGDDIFTYTISDGDIPTDSAEIVITVTGGNDAPSIIDNTIYTTEDVLYALSISDFPGFSDPDSDSMVDIRIDSLPANGTLYIDGVALTLADIGTATAIISATDLAGGSLTFGYLNADGAADDTSFTFSASDGSLWSATQTMSIDITPVADPLDVSPGLAEIGDPLFNLAEFSLGDDPGFINGVSTTYTSNGLVVTGTSPLNFNPGHGLGVDTDDNIDHTSSEAINIDGRYGESLDIELPASVFSLYIDVKGTDGDLIEIKLYDGATEITSGFRFEDGSGNDLVLVGGFIDGGDLSNGGDTIRIISNTAFDGMFISDADVSSSQDGFTLANIYDPSSISGFYNYAYNMNLVLGDLDGSEEISSVTLSGFDPSITTKLVFTYTDGITPTEEISSTLGVIQVIDTDLLADVVDGLATVTLASETQIATDFQPAFDAVTTEIGAGVFDSHTILGGTADETLTGGDGNDYIDGRIGIDTVDGGAGDDTLIFDAADTLIDGGTGNDILVVSSTINLSNVDNIETVQLNGGATVIGSDPLLGITAADVLGAVESDTLIIQSSDGNAYDQVDVHSSFGTASAVVIDGQDYAQYVDSGATLLIAIEDPSDIV